jgi:hypothetical protein
MNSLVRGFLLAACIGLAAACGGSSHSEGISGVPGVTALAPETASSSEGWKTYTGKGFMLELPDSWTAVGLDEDAPQEVLEGLPTQVQKELLSRQFFYALDASNAAMERVHNGKLAASFSVQQGPTPPTSWKRFVRSNSVTPEGVSDFRVAVVSLPAGRALMLTFNGSGPPLNQPRSAIEYLFLPEPDHVVGLFMETAPDLLANERPVFDEIAKRFRLAPP